MINEELKNLVSQFGTLVLVENNQPKFIVMTYDKFSSVIPATLSSGVIHKSVDNSGNFDKDSNEEIVDRLNEEILALKEQVAEKERQLTTNE